MSPSSLDLLHLRARRHGIDITYWDLWGREHQATPEVLEAILRALDGDALPDRPLASVAVTDAQRPVLRFEEGSQALRGRVEFALETEDGRRAAWDADFPEGVPAQYQLPGTIPEGYHRLTVRSAHQQFELQLIAAPDHAYQPERLQAGGKLAGLAVSLYGLRSSRNWGAGDVTDLLQLLPWVAQDLGCAFVALNPLHAIANRQPYNTSPYLPATAFFRNFLYLDVEAVPEFGQTAAARRLRSSARVEQEIASLREGSFVEYERVARLKLRFLKLLFRTFLRGNAARREEFTAWRERQGAMARVWSTYCALDEILHKRQRDLWIWPDWPAEYRRPDSPAVAAFQKEHPRLLLFYEWLQWELERQLAAAQSRAIELGMEIGLYHDLALATDRCGADLWAYGEFFVPGCRVGSPPDDFAPEGQDWSFPPPNTGAHQRDGYRLFIETIRRNSRPGGALRIDHVMRFFRLFWIPDGFAAKDGTYVQERWEDLVRILALESQRGRFLVVGEDLGTVPDIAREVLKKYGILSYRLFYFERGEGGRPKPPSDYPQAAIVSSTTHDLPTLAGFWSARDIEVRRAVGLLKDDRLYEQQKAARLQDKRQLLQALRDAGLLTEATPPETAEWDELTGEVHNAVIGFLASTPAALLVLNQEDLTKEPDQQNVPGTTGEYPNWRRKMRYTIEELQTAQQARDFARMFRRWLERTGRLSAAAR